MVQGARQGCKLLCSEIASGAARLMVVLAPGRRPWRTPPLAAGRRWTVGTPSDRRAASRRHPRCVGNPSGGVVVNGWCGSSRPRAARWRHPTRRLRPRWPSECPGVPTRRIGGSCPLSGHAGRHGATAFCTRRLLSTAPLATRRRAECAAEFARPRRVAGFRKRSSSTSPSPSLPPRARQVCGIHGQGGAE